MVPKFGLVYSVILPPLGLGNFCAKAVSAGNLHNRLTFFTGCHVGFKSTGCAGSGSFWFSLALGSLKTVSHTLSPHHNDRTFLFRGCMSLFLLQAYWVPILMTMSRCKVPDLSALLICPIGDDIGPVGAVMWGDNK